MSMVISQLGLKQNALQGETVVVTGAGGGIGYEAARALLWLGPMWSSPRSTRSTGEKPR